jgi:hypothetical protein
VFTSNEGNATLMLDELSPEMTRSDGREGLYVVTADHPKSGPKGSNEMNTTAQ